ncbi:hypothetical protein OUZ56_002331 [Daphnia magna]|uniref:Uncharacterized protein n=1 Tax=Daphnia magna TaxID=35525 RepID=A0ABR0A5C8_9CRUS|nr:hypothetical protein OUZ56_002331 [Daphnia magna]
MYMVAEHQHGRFDASPLHIAHALRATELKHSNRRPIEKPLDSYLEWRSERKKKVVAMNGLNPGLCHRQVGNRKSVGNENLKKGGRDIANCVTNPFPAYYLSY